MSWLFSRFEATFLSRLTAQSTDSPLNQYLRQGEVLYPLRALFVFTEMLVVFLVFWPFPRLLQTSGLEIARRHRVGSDIVLGVACGFIAFVTMVPFLWGTRATPFIGALINRNQQLGLKEVSEIILIGLLMPIATEIIFRAVVQSTLSTHMTPWAAIILSAILGAGLWSFYSLPYSIVLGLVCGALLWWRKALLPAIVADMMMMISAGVYVNYRMWS